MVFKFLGLSSSWASFLSYFILGLSGGIFLLLTALPTVTYLFPKEPSVPLITQTPFSATPLVPPRLNGTSRQAAPPKATEPKKNPTPPPSETEVEAIRARFVCSYVPPLTPTLGCAPEDLLHNPYYNSNGTSELEDPRWSPQHLWQLYTRERGLRELTRMFELFHVPDLEHCTRKQKLQQQVEVGQLCGSPGVLNPRVVWSPFSAHVAQRPFVRPEAAAVRKRAFRYQGFPFIDCNGFRNLADWQYETNSWLFGLRQVKFDRSKIYNRSLVYYHLEGRDLHMLRKRLPEVTTHFFIVTGCVDMPEYPDWLLNNPYVLKIFSVNVPRQQLPHPKIAVIPLGIRYTVSDLVNAARANATRVAPTHTLYASFSIGSALTSPRAIRRTRVLNSIRRSFNFSRALVERKDPLYQVNVVRHRFVLSPPGLGFDVYRTWQTLYLGRVPVVGPELPPELYAGLPVVQMTDWGELTPGFLQQQWQSLQSRWVNLQKLTFHYWMRYLLREALLTP